MKVWTGLAMVPVLWASVCLSGCSGAKSKWEKLIPPKVSVTAVTLKDINLLAPMFRVRLRLDNPNDEQIKLDGADAVLALNDKSVARGISQTPLDLPKLGSAEVDVDVKANTIGALKQLARVRQQELTHYTVTGNLHLLEPLGKLGSVPFRVQGDVKSSSLLKFLSKPK